LISAYANSSTTEGLDSLLTALANVSTVSDVVKTVSSFAASGTTADLTGLNNLFETLIDEDLIQV
jgi:hypothetical protein